MSLLPVSPVAVQVRRPMNPTSPVEFRSDVVVLPGGHVPGAAPSTLADAIASASKLAADAHGAVGVFQGRTGAFSLAKLGVTTAGGFEPLDFDVDPHGPIGGPYTDHFERTAFGAGATDAAALQAIVGAATYASFDQGGTGGALVGLAH